MFLTRTHLDRRTFLRGMGATVALPLLDAMIPARTLLAFTAAAPVPRLAFVYFPHGAVMHEWAGSGDGLQLGRILEPLAPFRDRLTIVSGLENRHAYGPVHAITPGTWLLGTSPRDRGNGSGGATADQLAAAHLGGQTPLPSIAVAAEAASAINAGPWEGAYDASYGATISFRGANAPVPMEWRPRAVFDTLFGCPSSPAQHPAAGEASVLDRVADDTARVRARLGPADRAVLGEYLETVRDVERRVQAIDDSPGRVTDRLALMFDLVALAFRADITRVATVMMAAEASSTRYEHLGVTDSFHAVSHHQNDPARLEQLVRIQAFHTRMFASLLGTLAALPDGDASLLDRSVLLYGSNMSDSHAHDHFPLPLAVAGGGCGRIRGGRHLRCADRTPISNLLLALLRRAGVPADTVGDSTGECAEL